MKHVPTSDSFVEIPEAERPITKAVEGLNACIQKTDENGILTYYLEGEDFAFLEPLIRCGMDERGMDYDAKSKTVRFSQEAAKELETFGLRLPLTHHEIDDLQEIMMGSQAEMQASRWSARAGIGSRKPMPSWMEEVRNAPHPTGVKHSQR